MGGTEILEPLKLVFGQPSIEGYARTVRIFLTVLYTNFYCMVICTAITHQNLLTLRGRCNAKALYICSQAQVLSVPQREGCVADISDDRR